MGEMREEHVVYPSSEPQASLYQLLGVGLMVNVAKLNIMSHVVVCSKWHNSLGLGRSLVSNP